MNSAERSKFRVQYMILSYTVDKAVFIPGLSEHSCS